MAESKVRRVRVDEHYTYDLYIPKGYDDSKQWPLMAVFHWSTARSTNMLRVWREAADEYGIVLIVPNSRYTMRWGKGDAKATLHAIADTAAELNIDPERVYATGFSSGGKFTYTLLAQNPGLFRAVGPFGGRMVAHDDELEHPMSVENTRVCIFHGTRDRRVRFKHARKALERLQSHGYDVHLKTYASGHWLPAEYVHEMWKCLDGARHPRDS